MEPQSLIGFVLVAVTLACTPGADWAYSISAGLARRSFVPAVAGLCSGYLLHTLLLALGLAALVASQPVLLAWITLAGAAYLLWLGFTTLRSWRSSGIASAGTTTVTGRMSFLRGVGTSGINPKGLLLFVAILPQFLTRNSALAVPLQCIILGLVFVVIAASVYSLVASLAKRLLASRPALARTVTLASGTIMIVLGVLLLAEQLPPLLAR